MNRVSEEKERIEAPDGGKVLHHFDIGDHIGRLLSLVRMLSGEGDSPGGGIMKLVKRMTSPSIIDAVPFGNQVLDDGDKDKLDGIHGKTVIIIKKLGDGDVDLDDMAFGRGRGGPGRGLGLGLGPWADSCPLNVGPDDEEDVEEIKDKVDDEIEPVRDASAEMVGTADVGSMMRSAKCLNDSFYVAMRCAEASKTGEPSVDEVADLIRACSPIVHRNLKSAEFSAILSGVTSDLATYIPTEGFFRNVADRIKLAYQILRESSDEAMVKSAFVVTRNPVEDFTGRQGVNICPKFKTQLSSKMSVPVEHSYCRDYCIEGRPEPDGTVTCKYADWLANMDTHEKVMARYPEQKNPVNAEMPARIPDGERGHPRKPNAITIEGRMQQNGLNLASHDTRNNMEALIGELLADGPSRSGEGRGETTERKLREKFGSDGVEGISERRLDDKRDDSAHGVGPENALESRMRAASPEGKFDHRKLIDELVEDEYPRDVDPTGRKQKGK